MLPGHARWTSCALPGTQKLKLATTCRYLSYHHSKHAHSTFATSAVLVVPRLAKGFRYISLQAAEAQRQLERQKKDEEGRKLEVGVCPSIAQQHGARAPPATSTSRIHVRSACCLLSASIPPGTWRGMLACCKGRHVQTSGRRVLPWIPSLLRSTLPCSTGPC